MDMMSIMLIEQLLDLDNVLGEDSLLNLQHNIP